MSRRPVIAGNWKMHKLQSESAELANAVMKELKEIDKALVPEVVIAPVFTSLYAVNKALTDCGCGKVKMAAQNAYFETQGAFTGEVSVEMVKDAGEMINKKAKKILDLGLIPIICCGESLEQREAGVTDSHIESQIKAALNGLSAEEIAKSIIAYEPIWAIGTGKTCDSDEANRVIGMIRNVVKGIAGTNAADSIRILYGGSVKPNTIEEQMSKSDIDGALVGGASLTAESFGQIVKGAMKQTV